MDIEAIQARLQAFAQAREWDQYHTPKNLSTALVCEAAELAEIFQWMTPEESAVAMADERLASEIKGEMADVFIYCLRLSHKLGIDLATAVDEKIELNAQKYPVEKAKGNATKYSRRKED